MKREQLTGERILRSNFKPLQFKAIFDGLDLDVASQSIFRQVEGDESVYWVKTQSSETVTKSNGAIHSCPCETSEDFEDFKDLIESWDAWHLGLPATDVKEGFKEIVWKEFQRRKSNADEDLERIEQVEANWAKACGKLNENDQIIQ